MSYLKTIATYINNDLEKGVLSSDCFDNRKMVAIAQTIKRERGEKIELLPSYVDNDGEACYVGPEDDFDLIIYNKVNNIVVTKANIPTFGDTRQIDANIARMSMVVFGKRNVLRMTNDEMAILIQNSIPKTATKELLEELDFRAANININEIVLNDLQVFQEEFQNVVFFLKPEQFLFKINYTIESAFLKECFKKN